MHVLPDLEFLEKKYKDMPVKLFSFIAYILISQQSQISHDTNICFYQIDHSKGARSYEKLAEEVIKRG